MTLTLTTPAAATLASLTANGWTVVARRCRASPDRDGWQWLLPLPEVGTLRTGREAGVFLTAQRATPGGWELLARRARGVPPSAREIGRFRRYVGRL